MRSAPGSPVRCRPPCGRGRWALPAVRSVAGRQGRGRRRRSARGGRSPNGGEEEVGRLPGPPPRLVRRSSRALSELVLIQTSQESLGRRVSARSGVPGHLLPAAASLSRPPVPWLVLPCEEKQPRRSRAYGSLPPRTAESRVSLRLILTLFFFSP